MAILHITEEQLRLIQRALDFYSRIGMGQFTEIKDHPTFEKHLHKEFTLGKKPFKVGDKTMRGEIVEICPKGRWIKTKGRWGKTKGRWGIEEEVRMWEDVDNIEFSTDYTRYHAVRDAVDSALAYPRNLLYNDHKFTSVHGGWGIGSPKVDESCREAFDLVQVIRHEFWKRNPDRDPITVDSSVHLYCEDSKKIKCEL